MKIGIVCAGDEELEPFLPIIENCKISEKAMLKFYEGIINGIEVVALFSGVCKVNAAIATQILIDNFKVNIIINSGVAGGIDSNLNIFDNYLLKEAFTCSTSFVKVSGSLTAISAKTLRSSSIPALLSPFINRE